MYRSTRGEKLVSASLAIINGISPDGGLYIPDKMPKISFNSDWLKYSYKKIAEIIFKAFFDDFTDEEIEYVVNSAYSSKNFKEEIVGINAFDSYAYLELYKGPTLAFKDMALTALPFLMEVAKKKQNINKKITILTATSGDTGGAALNGFMASRDIDIVVLYPLGGVSEFQERQMLSFRTEHSNAFAVRGNFDDCQRMVKEIFSEYKDNSDVMLSSANSINIGRLVPQIVYYFYGYLSLVNMKKIKYEDKIDVSVPTGNFGNILALYFAKKLGLPIDNLICASNSNNVLTDFFNTGIYDSNRPFYKTNAPSMDILISSNLERLLALNSSRENVIKWMNELKINKKYQIDNDLKEKLQDFKATYSGEAEIVDEIINEYNKNGYLIDSHTACSKLGYNKFKGSNYAMIVSTAHPVKFKVAFDELKIDYKAIENRLNYKINPRYEMSKKEIIDYIFSKSLTIKVPATTANLGSGFDVCGLALSIYNKYRFTFGLKTKLLFSDSRFQSLENNLVYKSYEYVFKKENKSVLPVIIEEIDINVPISRGLGSSSCCIVAGVCAAAKVLDLDKEKMLKYMVDLEGHPDNVAPAFLGGLVATLKVNDSLYLPINYPVNKKLKIILCVPSKELSTKKAREVLPKELSYGDLNYNLSRIIHLPKAFLDGDITLLKELLKDSVHQKYRLPLIEGGKDLFDYLEKKSYAYAISGAGPSILIIGDDYSIISELDKKFSGFKFIKANPVKEGVIING